MITSIQNSRVQWVRSLAKKPHARQDEQCFIVEGVRLAEEALVAGWPVRQVFFTGALSERGRLAIHNIETLGVNVEEVTPRIMDSLSETENSQGILAVMGIKDLPLPADLNLLVIADAIRDPGNLGTLIRTAAAAGAQALLLAPGTTDAFAPKVIRAAMGAHFRIPIQEFDWEGLRHLVKSRQNPLKVYLSHTSQGQVFWEADLKNPCAFVIGSEAEGTSPAALQLADASIHIPMPGKTESLNAAIAAAILLFDAVRQRSV